MNRTRTAERLSLATSKAPTKNRTEELDTLRQKFDVFSKQFKPFILSLKKWQASLVAVEKNRTEVLQHLELFTDGTPIYGLTGKGNSEIVSAPQWAKKSTKENISYCSLNRQMTALNEQFATQLSEYAIEYVQEWEIVVTTRVKTSLQKVDELKKDWLHYEKKVRSLEESEQKLRDKQKEPSTGQREKLKRNQEKLQVARQEYDKFATSVCHLIDSAVGCAWMDMAPLVYRLVNMEQDRVECLPASITELIEKVKQFADSHNIDLALPDADSQTAPAWACNIKSVPVETASAPTGGAKKATILKEQPVAVAPTKKTGSEPKKSDDLTQSTKKTTEPTAKQKAVASPSVKEKKVTKAAAEKSTNTQAPGETTSDKTKTNLSTELAAKRSNSTYSGKERSKESDTTSKEQGKSFGSTKKHEASVDGTPAQKRTASDFTDTKADKGRATPGRAKSVEDPVAKSVAKSTKTIPGRAKSQPQKNSSEKKEEEVAA